MAHIKNGFPYAIVSSLVTSVATGLLFVGAMYVADFDGETVLLNIAGAMLLVLSIVIWFLELRVIVPMLTMLPFCIVVLLFYVGDVGPVHFMEGAWYFLGLIVFFFSWVAATIAKQHAINRQQQPPTKTE